VKVIVGVDGAGRTYRLGQLAAAATVLPVRLDSATDLDRVTAQLAEARERGCQVLVDDAHRLPDHVLAALTDAVGQGIPLVIARRPTIDRPGLAALDEAVTARGSVEVLAPLDLDGVAGLLAAVTGRPAAPDAVEPLRHASAGLPAVAAAVAAAGSGAPAPVLVARVQQRLAVLDPPVAELARALALRIDLPDRVLAAAARLDPAALGTAMRHLRDHGMLVPDGDGMIPAVAQAVLAELPPAGRRRLHDTVARALIDTGGDPVTAARQLTAARARSPGAAEAYHRAAEQLRFRDPAAAMSWYEEALEAGADPAMVAAGRSEAAALLGQPVELDTPVRSEHASRRRLVAGAVAAHHGRAERAAEALLDAPAPGPALAVPALVGLGRLDQAGAAAKTGAPVVLQRLAQAAIASVDPVAALPLLIEAAEDIEASPPAVVLPDTPHALGAVVAVTAGDAPTAEHLLDRAVRRGVGGPVALDRHRALLAWVRMRTGRYDTAVDELRRLRQASLAGRERLLVAALAAGIARRSGDVSSLRAAWAEAEPALARRAVDLFLVEILEELLVAAARLRQRQRITPVLERLDAIVDQLGRPAAWSVAVGWIHLQVAIVSDDAVAAATAATALAGTAATGERQRGQCAAADRWARVLAGELEPVEVLAAADDLAAAGLPWEASRLTGDAAIRTGDPAAARRLLERARELANLDTLTGPGRTETSHRGLSDREIEVAQLVLAGRTHREIGAQLYLSPKTVEHHVARIRAKLGATSRAELVAALRAILDGGPG
jgi:DNA-binding CsgD family transcriptional regulator